MRPLLFAICLYLVWTGIAAAQRPGGSNNRSAQPPEPQPIEASGRIHSFNARQINVITTDDKPWQVALTEKTKVKLAGEAGPDVLRPRMGVRFYASLNKRGQAIEPIIDITMFSPDENFIPLVELSPETEEGDAVEAGGESRPEKSKGVKSTDEATESADEEEVEQAVTDEDDKRAARRSRRSRDADDEQESEAADRYFVNGIVTSYRRGKLVVAVGELGAVKGELADDAIVKLDLNTHAAARPGDEITFKGKAHAEGQAVATSIEITVAPPQVEEEKSKREKRPATSRTRHREAADADAEKEADSER